MKRSPEHPRCIPALVQRLALRNFPPSAEYLHKDADGFTFKNQRQGAHEFADVTDAAKAADKLGGWPVIIEAEKPVEPDPVAALASKLAAAPRSRPDEVFADLERRRLA